jgi:hypothetical protein
MYYTRRFGGALLRSADHLASPASSLSRHSLR